MRAIADGAILLLIDEGLGQRGNLGNGNCTYLILRLMREHWVVFRCDSDTYELNIDLLLLVSGS